MEEHVRSSMQKNNTWEVGGGIDQIRLIIVLVV